MTRREQRNLARITKDGFLDEREGVSRRRLDAQQFKPPGYSPTDQEVNESEERWEALKHQL